LIEERPIGAGLNRNLGSPTAPGEAVEHELTAFIEKRDKQRRQTEGERATEVAWMESEKRYNARRREENRLAWHPYHQGQAERLRRTVGPLIAFHEESAARLCAEERPGAAGAPRCQGRGVHS
jgi:hypothetical protein